MIKIVLTLIRAVNIGLMIYFLPRILEFYLGSSNPWSSFIYMYGLGGLVFFMSTIYFINLEIINLKNQRDSFWLKLMILGYFYMAGLHGLWIFLVF